MLDWFSGYVGYDASALQFGRVLEFTRTGEVLRDRSRWETAIRASSVPLEPLEMDNRPSHSPGIQVCQGMPTEAMIQAAEERGFLCAPHSVLRLSGNPSKFLQGHNVAGPSVSDLGPVLQALVRSLGDGFRPSDADADALPSVHRSRVDVTTSVDLGSHQQVHDWLLLAATNTRTRHGRARDSSGTVYWGKNSTRWTLKAYCKHCELKEHPPLDRSLMADLLEWTRPQLRIELTLRRPELKDRGTLSEEIIWEFGHRVEVSAVSMKEQAPESLRGHVRAALQLWYTGTDLTSMYSTATVYRYRKEILEHTGVDILLPRVEQTLEAEKVLLGFDELRAREVKSIPDRIQRSLFGAR